MKTLDEPRYCITCGKLLVRRPGEQCNNFKRRKTCGNGTPCHHGAVSRGLRNFFKGNIPYSPSVPESILYDDPRDAEQARINKLCAQRDAERMGLTLDPGRTLSKSEIKKLLSAGAIHPLEQIRTCRVENVYHWRL